MNASKKSSLIVLFALFFCVRGFTQFSGNYTIGTSGGENYSSLTQAGGLFSAINSGVVTGNVTISITTNLPNEDGVNALNQWASPFTIKIVPATASVKTITFNSGVSRELIDLNGADDFTIDGRFAGAGRFLKFVTTKNDALIQLKTDCKQVTIRNCVFSSDNTLYSGNNGGMINVNNTSATGCDNLQIIDNKFQDNIGVKDVGTGVCVYAPNVVGQQMTGLLIQKNEFDNIQTRAITYVSNNGEIEGSSIKQNSFYASVSINNSTTTQSSIYINSGSGHVVRGNFIGGQSLQCGGSKMVYDMNVGQSYAIAFGASTSALTAINIDSNVIRNIDYRGYATSPMTYVVIRVSGTADYNIGTTFGNVLGDNTVDASAAATSNIVIQERRNGGNNFKAIYSVTTGNLNVENNTIGGIRLEHNNVSGITVALISQSGASSCYIADNTVGGASHNIVKECDGDFVIINSTTSGTIEDNVINNIDAINNFSADIKFIGAHIASGDLKIKNNIIGDRSVDAVGSPVINVFNNSTTANYVRVIQVSGVASSVVVSGNQIGGISMTSSGVTGRFHLYGIHSSVVCSDSVHFNNNGFGSNLSNVKNLYQATDGAIHIYQITTPGCLDLEVKNNSINGILADTFFDDQFRGVLITGTGGQIEDVDILNNTFGSTSANNVVSPDIDLGHTSATLNTNYFILCTSNINSCFVNDNTFGGVRVHGTLYFVHVNIASGDVEVERNTFGNRSFDIAVSESISVINNTATASLIRPIYVAGTSNYCSVKNNVIGGIKATSSAIGGKCNVYGISSNMVSTDSIVINENQIGSSSSGMKNIQQSTDGDVLFININDPRATLIKANANRMSGLITDSFFDGKVRGIVLSNSGAVVGSAYVTDNYIGDTTVNAFTNPDMLVQHTSTSAEYHTAIDCSNSINQLVVKRNSIGGYKLINSSTGISTFRGVFISSIINDVSIEDNQIGSVLTAQNIYSNSKGSSYLTYVYNVSNTPDVSISNNVYANVKYAVNWNDQFFAIYSNNSANSATAGTVDIVNNKITDISLGSGGASVICYPIYHNWKPSNIVHDVSQNIITNLSVNSTNANPFIGMYAVGYTTVGSAYNIEDNEFTNVNFTNTSAVNHSMFFIYVTGAKNDYTFDANYIGSNSDVGTGATNIFSGLYIPSAKSAVIKNNVIMLSNAPVAQNSYFWGIYENSSAANIDVFHNTIDIRGSATGSRFSTCYYEASNSNRNFQNNIFNNRRSGGTGGHYALYFGNTAGALTSDYNLLYAEADTTKLVYYSGNKNITNWKATGQATNSKTARVSQDLVDTSNGHQLTMAGNDAGNAALGIVVDHDDSPRFLSVGYDMGAFEIEDLPFPLPVELLSFNSICENGVVTFNWVTASEINNDYFEIERSLDGELFEVVASVEGEGNSNVNIEYSVSVPLKGSEKAFYRLKQIDFDGESETFDVDVVGCDAEQLEFNIYPNPTDGKFSVSFGKVLNQSIKIRITNAIGGHLKTIHVHEKTSNTSIDLSEYQPGVYYLQFTFLGEVKVLKVVIF